MEKNLNRIKAVLADKQKTNRWLAEQLGRDQATVSKWCTNACQPPMETFMKIAQSASTSFSKPVAMRFCTMLVA